MIISKTRKWGNSLGVIIPKEIAKDMKLREDQEVVIEIKPKENVLKELFGFGKGKINKSTEEILKDARKGLSKYF